MNKIDGNTFLISIYGGHLGFQNGRHSIIKPVFLNILEIKRAREFISTANPIIGIKKMYRSIQSLKKKKTSDGSHLGFIKNSKWPPINILNLIDVLITEGNCGTSNVFLPLY